MKLDIIQDIFRSKFSKIDALETILMNEVARKAEINVLLSMVNDLTEKVEKMSAFIERIKPVLPDDIKLYLELSEGENNE